MPNLKAALGFILLGYLAMAGLLNVSLPLAMLVGAIFFCCSFLLLRKTINLYGNSFEKLSDSINLYIQSKKADSLPAQGFPLHFRPLITSFSYLMNEMDRQRALTNIIHASTSIANSHDTFEEAVQLTLEKVYESTKWNEVKVVFPHLEPAKGVYTFEEGYQISRQAKNVHDASYRNDEILSQVMDKKQPLWLKKDGRKQDTLEFYVPIKIEKNVIAVLCFLGYPRKDLDNDLFRVFEVISEELTQVKLREMKEQELKKASEMLILSSKMATIGEIASNVAHEINNPLAIIQGRAEQMEELVKHNNIDRDLMTKISVSLSKGVDRISHCMSSLRTISYDQSYQTFRSVSLRQIMHDLDCSISEKMTRMAIAFQMPSSIPDIEIFCHAHQIGQALRHLILYSCDTIAHLKEREIQLHLTREWNAICFIVADNGQGSSDFDIATITDVFYDHGNKRSNGIGLSIARKIVQLHKGEFLLLHHRDKPSLAIKIPILQSTKRESA